MFDYKKAAVAASLVLGGTFSFAGSPTAPQTANIVDTAIAAGSFKTLVTAVTQAGLVDTLKGPGPFTVFAPTDEAFAKIPKTTLDALLKDKERLTAVLTYHVVPGRVPASAVTKQSSMTTVNGKTLPIQVNAGKAIVGGANVVKTDIAASNGVIHVIDQVLLPSK